MSSHDAKTLVDGAYSLRYQLLEHERLRRLQMEHKESSRSLRERAHQLSKQTQQRRRALEEKKQAMARAEEERRRKALEERRNKQREATERFRTVLSRQLKPVKSPITFEPMYLTPSKPPRRSPAPVKVPPHTPPTVAKDRVVLGREVEIVPVFTPTTPSNKPNFEKKNPPILDDVLECIRGKLPEPSPSMESIVLSPEPHLPLNNQNTPTINEEDLSREATPVPATDDLSSNSSTISLRDSLDNSTEVEERESADGTGDSEKQTQSTIISGSGSTLTTTEQVFTKTNNPLDQTTESLASEAAGGPQKKGILKKASGSDLCMTTGGGISSAKKVRFTETPDGHSFIASKREGTRGNPSITPKMRISLNNRGLPSNHQILSSTITKIGTSNRNHSGRNGITIHIPQAMFQDTSHTRLPCNNMLRMPSMNKEDIYHQSEDDGDTLWTQISTFVHERNNEVVHERPIRGRCYYSNQQQVKLWKKQDHTPTPPIMSQVTDDNITSEEKRLMESIELINCKLRSINTRDTTMVGINLVIMSDKFTCAIFITYLVTGTTYHSQDSFTKSTQTTSQTGGNQ